MDIEEYSKYTNYYSDEVPELLWKYMNKHSFETYLDLGCGDGSLLYAINKREGFKGKKVHAVDLSQNRINLCKEISPEFNCQVGSACDIQHIGDNEIHFIASTQVIEHVPDDEDMIKEIKRVTHGEPTVYISTVFKKWYAWYFYRCNGKWALDPTHIREYTKDSQLLDKLEKHGFEILENKKTLIKYSISNFILRRIGYKKNKIDSKFVKILSFLKIPIIGYYNWEIVCRKNHELSKKSN